MTKLCALTFDDGPDVQKTPRVLEKLESHGVTATFFMIGGKITEATRPLFARMKAIGAEYANHSWGHKSMNEFTAKNILSSVDKTSARIKEFSGTEPAFFRPPNLALSDLMHRTIPLPFAGGVLGMDWTGCDTDAKQRADNVLKGMKDGAIILLHDVQDDPHPTPEALDILIPELKRQGYEFVTLSELFAKKGIKPEPHSGIVWQYVE